MTTSTNPADEAVVTPETDTTAADAAVTNEIDSQFGIECFAKLPEIVREAADLERSGDRVGAQAKYLEALKISAMAQAANLLSMARVEDDPELTRNFATLAFFNLERAGLENSGLAKFAITLLDLIGDAPAKPMNRQERRAAERKARKQGRKGAAQGDGTQGDGTQGGHVHSESCSHKH